MGQFFMVQEMTYHSRNERKLERPGFFVVQHQALRYGGTVYSSKRMIVMSS